MRTASFCLLCSFASGCTVASQSSCDSLDPRYPAAIEYLIADSNRYQLDGYHETDKLSGIDVRDTTVCAALDMFFKDVFEMGYGTYSRENPMALPIYRQNSERYRQCHGRFCPELKQFSTREGPSITVFLSEVMEDVLPDKSAIKMIAVPDFPDTASYSTLTSSMWYTSYEYLLIYNRERELDTVLVKQIFR